MGQESAMAMAVPFDSLSSSVVTERTGDSAAGAGEDCAGAAAGRGAGVWGAGVAAAASGAANSCSNSSSQSSAKIHEHDYIGCSSPISVDKPDDRGGGGATAAPMAEDPDLNLGLGLGTGSKTVEGGERSSLFQEVKLKLPSAGSKRGYSETVEAVDLGKGMKLLPAMFPWSSGTMTNSGGAAKNWRPAIQDPSRSGAAPAAATFTPFQRRDSSPLNHFSCLSQGEDTPSSSGPMVGWPPVQNFRKNTLVAPAQTAKRATEHSPADKASSGQQQQHSAAAAAAAAFVKVYMDGLPIGRKVDLDSNNSYTKLSSALKDMFSGFVSGAAGGPKQQKSSGDVQSLFDGYETEYVLTYEDKDGDLMLVGDVPWRMFAATVKRLRIMKGSDAIGLGVPRDAQAATR